MTIDPSMPNTGQLARLPHFALARRLLRPLSRALVLDSVLCCALLGLILGPGLPPALLADAAAVDWQGVPGPAIGSLFLAGTGLAACLVLASARQRSLAMPAAGPRSRLATLLSRFIPGPGRLEPVSWAATWPQAAVILLGIGGAFYCLWQFSPHPPSQTMPAQGWFVLAAGLALLSFPFLVCERFLASLPPESLPEAPQLRALVFLPIAFLLAEAMVAAGCGLRVRGTYWAQIVLSVALGAIGAELALRSLAVWFLPPPAPADARAAIGSVLARLVRRRSLSPTALADTIRDQFGLDFSRSWAIAYVRSAFAPVALLMLLLCWGLSGVTRIDLKERGVYERFGAPVAVLGRGLHVVLPWPFGVVRHVPYGVVQTVVVGIEPGAQAAAAPADSSTAEGPAPDSANRLWDQATPSDVAYIIASDVAGRQSFGTIEVDLQVLFRIGLDDHSAIEATYGVEAPDALVRRLSGTLLAHFFASQTLNALVGENTRMIATQLQTQLQAGLDGLHSGLDVVAINIAAIHPPSGAAEAYRSVQAAEIAADTTISTEQGRAETTASVAQRDAANTVDRAQASAAETLARARVERTNFTADEKADQAAGEAFLLERYLADLRQALAGAQLEILDNRLDSARQATLDLRPPTAPPPVAPAEGANTP